jgi:hypothetical protein
MPAEPTPTQRGVVLTVEDIERLSKTFQESIKPSPDAEKAGERSCGIIVCGNGKAV